MRHVHTFTLAKAGVFSDEWRSYDHIIRRHATVCHSKQEWARDDDGDGIREVHVNTEEGIRPNLFLHIGNREQTWPKWTTVRNFLRPFRGMHKKYLSGYVAICEFSVNLKRITPQFISALVTLH